jgi:hypothetical protein
MFDDEVESKNQKKGTVFSSYFFLNFGGNKKYYLFCFVFGFVLRCRKRTTGYKTSYLIFILLQFIL